MSVDFPLNGRAAHTARQTGPITGILHQDNEFHQQYKDNLRMKLNHSLTEEPMSLKIDEIQSILLEDLMLLESQSGFERENRRQQILDSYQTIKDFVQLRREFLVGKLGTPVQNWPVY